MTFNLNFKITAAFILFFSLSIKMPINLISELLFGL